MYLFIFDNENVLVNRNWNSGAEYLELHSNLKLTGLEYRDMLRKNGLKQYNLGQMSQKDFWISLQLSENIDVKIFQESIKQTIQYANHLALDLIERLSSKCTFALLTTTTPETFQKTSELYNPNKYFSNNIFKSYEMGIKKPNIECYKFVISKLGVRNEKVILIDDYLKNIDSALSIGINTIHYNMNQSSSFLENEVLKLIKN